MTNISDFKINNKYFININFIENCGLNQIDVPLPLIRKVESLYDIFNGVLLNDIIYNINQYL